MGGQVYFPVVHIRTGLVCQPMTNRAEGDGGLTHSVDSHQTNVSLTTICSQYNPADNTGGGATY